MRKTSELLPIARQYLMPKGEEVYTCYASHRAMDEGAITDDEYQQLSAVIRSEIKAQGRALRFSTSPAFLRTLLRGRYGEVQVPFVEEPGYWPMRDAWLDALQAKLEGQGQ